MKLCLFLEIQRFKYIQKNCLYDTEYDTELRRLDEGKSKDFVHSFL